MGSFRSTFHIQQFIPHQEENNFLLMRCELLYMIDNYYQSSVVVFPSCRQDPNQETFTAGIPEFLLPDSSGIQNNPCGNPSAGINHSWFHHDIDFPTDSWDYLE